MPEIVTIELGHYVSRSRFYLRELSNEQVVTAVRYERIYERRCPRLQAIRLADRLGRRLGYRLPPLSSHKWQRINANKKIETSNETQLDGGVKDRRADAGLRQASGEERKVPEKALSGGEAAMVKVASVSLAFPVGYEVKPLDPWMESKLYRWSLVICIRRPRRLYHEYDKERIG